MPDLRLKPVDEDKDVATTLPFPVDGARMLKRSSFNGRQELDAPSDIVALVDDAMDRLQERVDEVNRGLEELQESYQFPFDDEEPPTAA